MSLALASGAPLCARAGWPKLRFTSLFARSAKRKFLMCLSYFRARREAKFSTAFRPRGGSLPRATARPREKRPREKPQLREKTTEKMRAFPLPTVRPQEQESASPRERPPPRGIAPESARPPPRETPLGEDLGKVPRSRNHCISYGFLMFRALRHVLPQTPPDPPNALHPALVAQQHKRFFRSGF